MQSVSAAFTAQEKAKSRDIADNLLVAWHLQTTIGNKTFTIGASTIGGNDVIGLNPGAIGSPGIYKYFDESTYVQSLAWERGYNIPEGGAVQGMAEAVLNNTSKRFLPSYMGGHSELYTAILPRRPITISAGFKTGSTSNTLPQFSGLLNKQPFIDIKNRQVTLEAADYMSYFQNAKVDKSPIYTGITTDAALRNLFILEGMSTAQFKLDAGLNTIPFFYYDTSAKYLFDVINQLVQAENGNLYQDELGVFRFENRQHWNNAPYNQVQKVITTYQVIDAQGPKDDHIINNVQVTVNELVKQSNATLYTLPGSQPITLFPGNTQVTITFTNPVLMANTPTYTANSASDGSGLNKTANASIVSSTIFAESAVYTFNNNTANTIYLTALGITGRQAIAAQTTQQIVQSQNNHSRTAYQDQILTISNPYIQNPYWAASFGQLIVNTFGVPENLQVITIRAIPELQIGDLVSWQGAQWRVWDIKAKLDPSAGFTQELSLLKRNPAANYFRIGVSTIGGQDQIAA